MVAAGVIAEPAAAFTHDWLAPGGRAYVAHYALDPLTAVGLVRDSGGVSVLAHPKVGEGVPDRWIAEFADAGLFGVEVDHPDQNQAVRAPLRRLVEDLGLAATGSSDDHGALTGHRLGCETTQERTYEQLVDQATGAAPITR
jgi:hypothetical protein